MKKNMRKYPVLTGLLLSAISLLFSLFFTTLIYLESVFFHIFAFLFYCGSPILLSFFLCFSIQSIYKIWQFKNGFLFRLLCVINILELCVLLCVFSYGEITNMVLFIVLILILIVVKIIILKTYHFLYPRDKKIDSILYWVDLWKGIFISIVITCMVVFLTIMIVLSNW